MSEAFYMIKTKKAKYYLLTAYKIGLSMLQHSMDEIKRVKYRYFFLCADNQIDNDSLYGKKSHRSRRSSIGRKSRMSNNLAHAAENMHYRHSETQHVTNMEKYSSSNKDYGHMQTTVDKHTYSLAIPNNQQSLNKRSRTSTRTEIDNNSNQNMEYNNNPNTQSHPPQHPKSKYSSKVNFYESN